MAAPSLTVQASQRSHKKCCQGRHKKSKVLGARGQTILRHELDLDYDRS